MNAAVEQTAAAPAGNDTDSSETIKMSDGRDVTFNGKSRRMLKEPAFDENGKLLGVRFDFRFEVSEDYPENTILVPVPGNEDTVTIKEKTVRLVDAYTAYGISQKLGDAAAGPAGRDAFDMFEDVREMMDQVNGGDWRERREGSGLAGASILFRALVESGKVTGKTPEDARALLKSVDAKTKAAMRVSPKLKPIVDRLEAEKAAKSAAKVDTSQLLQGW